MGPNYDEIIAGRLWVGGYVREEEIPQLMQIGITTVVNLQTDEDLQHCGISPDGLARAYQDAGIELRRLPIQDFDWEALARNLAAAEEQVANALAKSGTRLYLHCTAGVNRSATAAAAFLIRSRGMSAPRLAPI